MVAEYTLSSTEAEHIQSLAESLDVGSVDDERFLTRAAVWAGELPRNLRAFLEDFRATEGSPACRVAGLPVDSERMGPTPVVAGRRRSKAASEIRAELVAVLLSSCLGDVFGWRLQHDGLLIHDLAPRPEHEDTGLGTGSRQHINWHTEDSFHPCRADYVGLLCVRNPAQVPTTIGFLDISLLSDADRRMLAEPVFTFKPDPSYFVSDAEPFPGPDRGSILYGDSADPYLRFDQDYIDLPADVAGVEDAVACLRRAIEVNLIHLSLRSGDFLFLDNRRAVHGRASFQATYVGTERWVKRVNITSDLKRSRHLRGSASDRVIRV
ncbi:TauD/TfdA family dioxygenase [Micromonospora citrea]|uniref:TauD/TfdA family dioxygenase n=1 Tax=Micromonospora citrea TaxID=47855 RepID=UPI001C401E47|nr:TauD/TfdA family dioxygenase [Micromonospora citrea]